jgi:hypothetical protein
MISSRIREDAKRTEYPDLRPDGGTRLGAQAPSSGALTGSVRGAADEIVKLGRVS